tara:strand:- start:55 stop:492 length:438 start_codon:yes stop_codon:yes gene_type:complete
MSTFTPNKNISDSLTIITIEKTGAITSGEIEYTIEIGGDSSYGGVDLDGEEFDVAVDLNVGDFADFCYADIDNVLSALVKHHPEHMSKRLFASAPTDADAIKALMERLDELDGKHAVMGAELGAIRRAAGMLTVATPTAEQPVNK